MKGSTEPLRIQLPNGRSISGILRTPATPSACFVFAHGAGAGMDHAFMANLAGALAEREIATLRFQFPFMEEGSKRPDSPTAARAAVRAAAAEAASRLPGIPLFAGGKSFGGRMTSQAQAESSIPGVRGLIFVGFPLHPAGKPGTSRADHLAGIGLPMLFLQGTRDALADIVLMRRMACALDDRATLCEIESADHAFHVTVRSGRKDDEVIAELADKSARWIACRRR